MGAVLDALEALPDDVDRRFGERGVDIYLDRRWTDIWPSWEPEESTLGHRGNAYANWAEVGAYYEYEQDRIIMVEEIKWEGDWSSDRNNAPRTIRHELGHALDYTSDPRPSQDAEFRTIYLDERGPAKDVGVLDYYTHHWAPGAIETFASAFAALHGPLFDHEDEAFRTHFPRCIKWVENYWLESA